MILNSTALASTLLNTPAANDPIIGYQNLVTSSNIAVGTEEALYPGTNLANPNTASVWVAASTADQNIVITLAGETIDYVAICGQNWAAAAVPITLSVDDGGGYDVIFAEFTPTDDKPLILRFVAQVATVVKIRLNTGGTAAAEAAVIYVGRSLTLQRRLYVGHTPITLGRVTQVESGRSESGRFLGRVITGEHRESSISLQNLTASWVRTYLDPFLEAAQTDPFFVAWRPGDYPAETGFAWLTGDPQPSNARSNGMMAVDLPMQGIA